MTAWLIAGPRGRGRQAGQPSRRPITVVL
jgi:hypothetical protein